jgi:hypothetical protein
MIIRKKVAGKYPAAKGICTDKEDLMR